MSYPHQPGSPQFDGSAAYEAYLDDMEKLRAEPPQQWVQCDACNGLGVEVHGIWVYEHGCGFPHQDTDETPCGKCNGAGGWLDNAEADAANR